MVSFSLLGMTLEAFLFLGKHPAIKKIVLMLKKEKMKRKENMFARMDDRTVKKSHRWLLKQLKGNLSKTHQPKTENFR